MQIRVVTVLMTLLVGGTLLVSLTLLGATASQIGAFLWLLFLTFLIGAFVFNQIRRRPNRSH